MQAAVDLATVTVLEVSGSNGIGHGEDGGEGGGEVIVPLSIGLWW